MLASVPGQLIGANWTLGGRRNGLRIAAADDGEWIAAIELPPMTGATPSRTACRATA